MLGARGDALAGEKNPPDQKTGAHTMSATKPLGDRAAAKTASEEPGPYGMESPVKITEVKKEEAGL